MKKSKVLQQLDICKIREAILDKKMEREHYNLNEGHVGEAENYQRFKQFGSEYWRYDLNYWFNHGKRMEVDMLVIAENQWLVIEVKNYKGLFEYKNNECFINGRLMSDNQVTKMNHRVNRIRHMAAEVSSEIEVIGAMVFINEHSDVKLESGNEFDIVMRNQLQRYIRKFRENNHFAMYDQTLNRVYQVLERHRDQTPFVPKSLSLEVFEQLRKGITCKSCDSFDVRMTYKYVECRSCSAREQKSEAILRTAYQLRYLYYDHPEMVTRRNVYEFCGGMVSERTINRTLAKNYEKIGATNNLYYEIQLPQ